MEEISRELLARGGEQGVLSGEVVTAALEVTGLRPSLAEWREFGVRALRFAGVLSLASGVIFLVAFNWQDFGIYGRFGAVEIPLLATLVVAWWKGLETLPGKLALMLAVMLTGALLALFGQTYQTGADVYELFLAWAVLALPWVIACRYTPCWALWVVIANLAVGLYAGINVHNWVFALLLDRWQWSPWSIPFLFNLLLYVTVLLLAQWPRLGLSERWLHRAIIAAAMAFGTCAMIYLIFGGHRYSDRSGAAGTMEVLLYLGASAGLLSYAFRQRDDLFNFAVLALSWVAVTTTLLARALMEDHAGIGALFILGMYLIGASTGAVKAISYLGRQWQTKEAQ
jgi:uncharacterized membrane protein